MLPDYEKLGAFYLGKKYDIAQQKLADQLLMYDSKDLTTHGVIVGMTGSGKTGLALDILEEAAIDNIPVIAIDPKGDLGNLMLTFPNLMPADFRPWVDNAEATRRGLTTDEFARDMAKTWKEGLASWDQAPERIAKFKEAADVAIYTPGSQSGIPLTVLKSFDAPNRATLENAEAFRDRVTAAASGLLALLGIDADPIRSREHILLSNLLERAWRDGKNVAISQLIRDIQSPPFDKIGVMDLDSFFPAQDRFGLAMSLNNLLASPGFSAWMEGEPLDIRQLLNSESGKPRISILSIAHLSDAERMFFVTILLNEVLAWMRAQPGTSSLRAILYMDEVFGYFPPTANPPAKKPMLTLLKQARAYGLGVLLATQNPVDLDYKGLSNCGTWFIGRLQTERDKLRVLDGLEGASTAAGKNFDRNQMEATISGLGKRVFLMNNVHEDEPVIFQTRWTLSYLSGPLTREQIQLLMQSRKSQASPSVPRSLASAANAVATGTERPVLPPGIAEFFQPFRDEIPEKFHLVYRPALFGLAKVRFAQASAGIDVGQSLSLLAPIDGELPADPWENAQTSTDGEPALEKTPQADAPFGPLPAEVVNAKKFASLPTALKDHLYRTHRLRTWRCKPLKIVSNPDETEREFRARFSQMLREQRDLAVQKLRVKYAPKLTTLQDQVRRAEQKVQTEREQANQQGITTALSFGATIASVLLGSKKITATNISKAATSARTASRMTKEQGDISKALDNQQVLAQRLADLDAELGKEAAALQEQFDAALLPLEELQLQPKKTDISVTRVALVWQPYALGEDGTEVQLS